MPTIPASAIVNVLPGVINAGGTGLELSGLLVAGPLPIPVGQVWSFASADAVAARCGATSSATNFALTYFAGYDNSTQKPAALLITQYNQTAVAPYLRSGSLAGMTLAQLQALSGTLTVPFDGAAVTSGNINLASATDFPSAAALIQAAFGNGATVNYSNTLNTFKITGPTTGAAHTIGYATGSLATPLAFSAATADSISPGADISVPATFMDAVVAQTQNWATFTTAIEPVTADKVSFAAWANAQEDRYAYAMWDTATTAAGFTDTTSAGAQILAAGYSGTLPIYSSGSDKAAMAMGAAASFDFTRANGRATLAFKSQSGLSPDVTNAQVAANLIAHGYNFYGSYGTAAQGFMFFYPGQITGEFEWFDSYVNQIWLNNAFQLALMELLTTVTSIPYNDTGYGLIEAALLDPINAAVSYGAIRAGVTLSALQVAEVNAAAGGLLIADTLSARGWYLLIQDASPQVRQARGSPPCTFFYLDGESIQKITLASIEVQ